MSEFKRDCILVPVDFHDASANALRVAAELAGSVSRLRILHVLPELDAISPGVVWGDFSDENRAKSVRTYAAEFLQKVGMSDAPLEVRVGRPGHLIAEYAQELGADLIVISSHGYHGVKRLLLGSVAESVIREARCAVLVLRRTDAE